MPIEITYENNFFIVYFYGNEISRKKDLVQATKALAKYVKGQS